MIENYERVLSGAMQPAERECVRMLHALKTHRADPHDIASCLPLLTVYAFRARRSRQGVRIGKLCARLEHLWLYANMMYPNAVARCAGRALCQKLAQRPLRAVLEPAATERAAPSTLQRRHSTATRFDAADGDETPRRCRPALERSRSVATVSPRVPWR